MGSALVWETLPRSTAKSDSSGILSGRLRLRSGPGVRHDFVLARCTVRPEDDPEGAGVCRDCHFDFSAGDWREHDDLQLDPLDTAEPCAGPHEPGRKGVALAGKVEQKPVPFS